MDFRQHKGSTILRARDQQLASRLSAALTKYSDDEDNLEGIRAFENKTALIEQMIDSIRRIKYIQVIRDRKISQLRADPKCDIFDPLKAAIIHTSNGNIDEACWLIFLAIHFGKANPQGWALTKDIYSALDEPYTWEWKRVSFNPDALSEWIAKNYQIFMNNKRRFGNHRKYESLNPSKSNFTGLATTSYIKWILNFGSHQALFNKVTAEANGNPREAFKALYKSMDAVYRFGRTAKFDYLTMLAKVGIINIEADSTYMGQATGPVDGAKLLFEGSTQSNISRSILDKKLINLDKHLNVGMQVLEDALCNWQKSPGAYKSFRG